MNRLLYQLSYTAINCCEIDWMTTIWNFKFYDIEWKIARIFLGLPGEKVEAWTAFNISS